ncbi:MULTISPECIES: LysM peptidoglycan-binding domain-containing protein [unclassified Acinetobacter]|uniref:LysM peptidoglycan-binding domain-containing protein n=1 Tax=unclassified Acinetobacter TaxID=196816 RepID=UPI0035B762D0
MKKSLDSSKVALKNMFKQNAVAWAIFAGLSFGVVADVQAKSPNQSTLRADAPNVYVVKKGDTLWAIAGRFLNKPWQWPTIWAANRQIRNPHLIYPGDRILLCTVNGKPLIGRDEGDGCTGIIRRATGTPAPAASAKIRVEALNNAIPLIPLENIRNWLEKGVILSPEASTNLPYVVGMTEQRVIAARGDKVYLRGNGLNVGQRYGIYRENDPYTVKGDKGKETVVAKEYSQVAEGAITGEQNGVYTFEILANEKEVRKGDVVMPVYDTYLPTVFQPIPAKGIVDGGSVVRVVDGVNVAGVNSIVTINRGTQHGVDLGHLFSLQQRGEMSTDPKTGEQVRLPDEEIGHALVFKTFDNMSYAYVTDSSGPIRLGARLATPME